MVQGPMGKILWRGSGSDLHLDRIIFLKVGGEFDT